jgi:aryl-alcohol dehydrogenase-like predicted oxidoreductase
LTPTKASTSSASANARSSTFDRFTQQNLAANKPFLDFLERFAKAKNATPAQVSLAWLLAQKPWILAISGTRDPDHLRENLQTVR